MIQSVTEISSRLFVKITLINVLYSSLFNINDKQLIELNIFLVPKLLINWFFIQYR